MCVYEHVHVRFMLVTAELYLVLKYNIDGLRESKYIFYYK